MSKVQDHIERHRTALTRHLQGLKDSVGGFTFEMLGEAAK